jgi:hypothetical protein
MKILDVRPLPLSYRCEKSYMNAVGGQMARNILDIKGSGRALSCPMSSQGFRS